MGRGGARGSPERKGGEFCHFRVGVHREPPGPLVLATGGDRVLREGACGTRKSPVFAWRGLDWPAAGPQSLSLLVDIY